MLSHSTQDYKMVQPISGVHEFQQNEGEPDEMLGGHLLHSDKENLPKTQELL